MNIYDLKFDNGQGEIEIDEAAGVVDIKLSESNPSYPGGGEFKVPLNPILDAIKAKVSADGSFKGKLEAYGITILENVMDSN